MSAHRLRAPRDDGAVLADPPLADFGTLLEQNRARFDQPLSILGKSWNELRHEARTVTLEAARAYLSESGEPLPATTGDRLVLAGHQPELFHPGVWVKNFALHGLATKHGAVPVNLIVDNDIAKHTLLHVPVGERLLGIPFDHWQGGVPFEERKVLDEELFASLPERVRPLTQSWSFRPMLDSFWNDVRAQSQRTNLLGQRLVAARRICERRWGCHQLEVPLSRLCRTRPFAWFAWHVLDELPRFRTVYNESVARYRTQHGIRSPLHPVPDLAAKGDWLETPFWAWIVGETKREHLFARLAPDRLHLRLGDKIVSLPRPQQDAPKEAIAAWQNLEADGIKIRTRALTTTIFSRLFIGDAFIHGIGGGKYDELTDHIIRRFYELEPPRFMVLSATLHLPLPRFPITTQEVQELHREQRDLWWNPQRHLDGDSDEVARWKQVKEEWIARPEDNPRQRKDRFEHLRASTEELRNFTLEDHERTRQKLVEARAALAVNGVRGRRDYSFCLFPEETLREFVQRFS